MKNFILKLKEKLSKLYNKNKKLFVFTLSLVIIIFVCFLFLPKSKSTTSKEQANESTTATSANYSDELEGKIKKMLLSLDEVNKVSVMIVCDSSSEIEYLKSRTETTASDGSTKTVTEEIAYEKDGSKTSAIIVSEKLPKIVGVWVIINSVSASTKLAITNSIISVLNIPETSISILQER